MNRISEWMIVVAICTLGFVSLGVTWQQECRFQVQQVLHGYKAAKINATDQDRLIGNPHSAGPRWAAWEKGYMLYVLDHQEEIKRGINGANEQGIR